MGHVVAARAQMGTSLAFHIVFAALGVGLPVLALIAEGLWLRTRDRTYYDLARTWAKAMAILFAVGAVSGTVLAFELGLLWPEFMRYAGGIIGLPFSLEGFAFFIEAIFIGLYLYGWERLSPVGHWLTIFPVAISGAISAAFVTCANAWMNMPTGFRIVNGQATDVQPLAAMFSPPWQTEVLHTTLAAYVFTAFGVASVYAVAWLRGKRSAKVLAGIRLAMLMAVVAIPLQIIAGDISARFDAEQEPVKFASLEALYHTQPAAPVTIGGIVDQAHARTIGALEIPGALSFLVAGNPHAVVRGLDAFPASDEPPLEIVHLSFDLMVGSGTLLLVIAAWWLLATRAKSREPGRPLARALAISSLLALAALEAGWVVTEMGRQPWIARGLLRTDQAVTIVPGLDITFYAFSVLYVILGALCWWLVARLGAHQ
ncbi:MAG TPA: cytochrome ubiquinol oxidase subunit I [Candidatus Baltobacteraceae bacterium]